MDYKNILFIAAAVAAAVTAYAVVEMRSVEVDETNEVVSEVLISDPATVAQEQAEEMMDKEDGEAMEKMEKDATSTEEVMDKEEEMMDKMENEEGEVMEKDEQ